ncbi:MAG: ATP synthase subunit I [Porticoccaceae bacterium]|nr:ATP synthase subunit I [Porticoccaceae bacterium]
MSGPEAGLMESAHQGDLKLALVIAATQLTIVLLLAILFVLFETSILSAALVGALIGLAASCSFALISLRSGTNRSAGKVLLDLYLGQLAKWIVIVITMVATFKYLPGVDQGLNILVLLAVFLLTQSAYIIAPSVVQKML